MEISDVVRFFDSISLMQYSLVSFEMLFFSEKLRKKGWTPSELSQGDRVLGHKGSHGLETLSRMSRILSKMLSKTSCSR